MELVLRFADGERDVDVDLADPEATVADLLAALEIRAIGSAPARLHGRDVTPDTPLADLGLLPGDRLDLLTLPDPTRPPVGSSLDVIGGPAAGDRIDLTGRCTVGREPESDVVVADPTLSHVHFVVEPTAEGVLVSDLDSRNGTYLDGARLDTPTVLPAGSRLRAGASTFMLSTRPDAFPARLDRPHTWGRPAVHNRPPRLGAQPVPAPLAAPPVPDEKPHKAPFNMASMIGPMIMGGAMVMIYGNLRFALFALLSPIMAVVNWISSKRREKRSRIDGLLAFEEASRQLDHDLADRADAERRRLATVAPTPSQLLERAEGPATTLWERRTDHDDFLVLGVGEGNVDWQAVSGAPSPDGVLAPLGGVLRRWQYLNDAPVTVEMRDRPVGICGDRHVALGLARWLLVQAAVQHGPADLEILVICSPQRALDWDFTKWLPHTVDPEGGDRRIFASTETAAAALDRILAAAPDKKRVSVRDEGGGPHRLVVVDDLTLFEGRRSPLRQLLRGDAGPATGIVLAASEDRLPALCRTVIVAGVDGDLRVEEPQARRHNQGVVVTGCSEAAARRAARALCRFEDPEQHLPGGNLPTSVRLLPLLDLDPLTPENVAARWQAALPAAAPSAPIGRSEDGPFVLDMALDGPHALVGGTTGSGKSELLRAWVAGLAASCDPDHLVFVLVDYKGGSAFDECARLPHTVGLVTDLDGHLGERALRSLEAELHHREQMLRDAGSTDLPEYLRAGTPLGPLPRLAVVIDEFATLATELPDFLGALVGIAQRGRSLGVHLVLATQRPSGAVNANIKANTNLRISLRVQDPGDSTDIIDRPDAAAISASTPGRLFVRRGHGDVVAVQSARATGPYREGGGTLVSVRNLTVVPHLQSDSSTSGNTGGSDDVASDERTELAVLVDTVRAAFSASGRAAPRRPWREMLAEQIDWSAISTAGGGLRSGGIVPFAMVDEPEHQQQVPFGWDPSLGHLALFGAVGSGTTTAAVSVVRSIAERDSADDVHVFIVDGGGGLGPLREVPHVGDVVPAGDRSRVVRLLRMLSNELDRRRGLEPAVRAAEPDVVVVVDGIGVLLGELSAPELAVSNDQLRRVLTDGLAVGIRFVVTADRPQTLGSRLGAAIGQRAMFRHADPGDFGAIGMRPAAVPDLVPGRFVEATDLHVCQTTDPGPIDDIGRGLRPATWPPAPIGTLPLVVRVDELPAPTKTERELSVPIGIEDDDLGPALLRWRDGDHILVTGPPMSGRSNVLVLLADAMRQAVPEAIIVAVGVNETPLEHCDVLDAIGEIRDLTSVLEAGPEDQRPWLVLVDDAGSVEDERSLLSDLLDARRPNLRMAAAARPDELRPPGHWSRPLRRSRTGVLLRPELSMDGDLFGIRLPRHVVDTMSPGRGFLVNAGSFTLTQTALSKAVARDVTTS